MKFLSNRLDNTIEYFLEKKMKWLKHAAANSYSELTNY